MSSQAGDLREEPSLFPLRSEAYQMGSSSKFEEPLLQLPPPPPPLPHIAIQRRLRPLMSHPDFTATDFKAECRQILSELLSAKENEHIAPDQLPKLYQALNLKEPEHALGVSEMMRHTTVDCLSSTPTALARFKKLNEKKVVPGGGILAKIGGAIEKIRNSPFYHTSFSMNRQMHVEHLGSMKVGTGAGIARSKTLEFLKKITPSPERDILIKALNYAIESTTKSPDTIKADINKLQPGESRAISVIKFQPQPHAMIMSITCTGFDQLGKKKFKVVHHNSGYGIETYHYRKVGDDGKQRYQTALEIEDVSEEKLCGRSSSFINKLCGVIRSPKELYEDTLPLLGGKIAPPSKDPRLWSHGQLSGSCSLSCLRSLVRANLPPKLYYEFRDTGRIDMLLKSYKQIKGGWGNYTLQRTAALEVVKALERSFQRRGGALPAEMQEAKKQLEEMHTASALKRLEKGPKLPTGSISDWLTQAFTLLSLGKFTSDAMKSADMFIREAGTHRMQCTEEDVKKLQDLLLKLRDYCKGKTLTKEETAMVTAFASAAYFVATSVETKSPMSKEIDAFFAEMHHRYNALCLDSVLDHPFKKLINLYQEASFSKHTTEPEGLQRMKQKSAAAA